MKQKIFTILLLCLLLPVFAQTNNSVSEQRKNLVEECKKYIGTPYLYGGLTKEGIDCSGFVFTAVRDATRIQLPRTVQALYSFVRIIPDNDKQIGDLVFFRTVESKISHVGIYIGKNQFIHAVSDGPNTGVIVSSLAENYWKTRYSGIGCFFPIEKKETAENYTATQTNTTATIEQGNVTQLQTATKTIAKQNIDSNRFFLDLDVSVFMNWNLFTSEQFLFNVRGASIQVHAQYNRWILRPGLGFDLKFEPRMSIVQLPILFSLAPTDFLKIYAGPVFTFGQPNLILSDKKVLASIFPGIIGFSWQTPAIKIGPTGLRFVQDISYSVFNSTDNSALSFIDSASAGLSFQTGIRLDIYLPAIKK